MLNVKLPQFTRPRSLEFKARQIQKGVKSLNDIILGRDFMQQIGLDLLYSSKQMEWGKIRVEMSPKGRWNEKNIQRFHKFENGRKNNENFYSNLIIQELI